MFPSRNLKRSVVAFKNFAKCSGTCSKAIASDHYRTSSNYSSHSHSYGRTNGSKWTTPFLYAAGGAILLTGLKSQLESNKAYAEEIPQDLGSATAIESEVTFMEPIVQAEAVEEVKEVSEEETAPVVEEPPKPKVFPEQVQYLLVGGGTASYSAMRAIRKRDVTAKVLIVTDEAAVPYMRPPLSKELWFTDEKEEKRNLRFKQWNGKYKTIHYDKQAFYCPPEDLNEREEGGVAVATGRKVVKVNASDNVATLDDGTTISYEKCLLATGGSPKNLPVFEKADDEVKKRVTLFRKIQDFLDLDDATDNLKSVTVIGGGFLGSELSCALAFKGQVNDFRVNQVFRETGNMARVLPEYLTKWTTNKVRREGVNVVPRSEVDKAEMTEDNRVRLTLTNGQQLVTDHVIVAVGLEVDTDLARSSGIEVDDQLGGYRVNTELQARSNIWVAGDASCFYDTKLGRRRVEHHDHAVVSGRLAGENMTGAQKSYYHQSMFWSDLGPDVGYEAIGVVDSSLSTVAVFSKASPKDTPAARDEALALGAAPAVALEQQQVASVEETSTPLDKEEFQKGVIFYLRDDVVVGVLLWNVFGRMSLARKIIREQQKHQDFGELAKLFQVYKDELDEE